MNQNPIISIIVPIYNAELYLKDCIESVLKQDDFYWELLLLDDGSSDGSAKICKSYIEDERIIFIQKNNSGVADTRKKGVEKSKGEYILFLDADDYLPENALSQYRKYLTSEVDIIATKGFYSVTDKGTITFKFTTIIQDSSAYPSVNEALKSSLLGIYTSCVWGGLYRRKLLLSDYTIPKLKIGEDLALNLNLILLHRPKIRIIDDILYYYRENPLSAMHYKNTDRSVSTCCGQRITVSRRMEAIADLMNYLLQFIEEHHLYNSLRKEYAFRVILLWRDFVFFNYKRYRLDKALRKRMKKLYRIGFKYLYPHLKFYILLDFLSPTLFDRLKSSKHFKYN